MTPEKRSKDLRELTAEMVQSYQRLGGINRLGDKHLPSHRAIVTMLEDLQALVFPGYHGEVVPRDADLELLVGSRLDAVGRQLAEVVEETLRFCRHSACRCEEIWNLAKGEATTATPDELFSVAARQVAQDYLGQLPAIRDLLDTDVLAAFEGDPAATNTEEIILCYPGVTAILVHRLAHPLYRLGVPLLPRIMSEWAHHRTGVDIHPGLNHLF